MPTTIPPGFPTWCLLATVFAIIHIEPIWSMRHYKGSPSKLWGYKTEPRSYVYHHQYFPKTVSKSFYESDSYDHQRPLFKPTYHNEFDDDHGSYFNRNKLQRIIHHNQPPKHYEHHVVMNQKKNKKKKDHDSIKINFEIPMKKMFDKDLGKELMGLGGHEKHDGGHGEEHGYGQDEHGYHQQQEHHKENGKEFDIKIPKFDVEGMLDNIKDKI